MNHYQIPVYQTEIEQFCERVQEKIHPDSIILHGSIARGTHTATSDIDIVVIGGNLADDFFTRMFELNRLRVSWAIPKILQT